MTTTLTSAPLASLLDRLFAQAEESNAVAMPNLSGHELQHMMHSKTEYRSFYSLLKDVYLPVSRESGVLLYMLARNSNARNIVEFGTSFGISTLYLAAALRDNGGGMLIGSEFEPSKVARAREHVAEGGVADLVEIREGDALITLSVDLPDSVDLVLLDGAKALYCDILALVENHMRTGGLIVADNANDSPEYLARVRSADGRYLSIPFSDGVEVSMRIG